MDRNRELFGQVHELISAQPEKHDQSDWTDVTECGTTHCVGGWAIALTHPGAENLVDAVQEGTGVRFSSYNAYAGKLLGLKPHEAYALFYCTDNEEAVRIAGEFARDGESPALDEVMESHAIQEEDF